MMFMMFPKDLDTKKRCSRRKLKGHIVSSNDHSVTVKLAEESIPFQKGQRLTVSIPSKRKTASGRVLNVSEVVAHGVITDVTKNTVTIHSRKTSPMISKSALKENEGKENLIIVEKIR